MGDFEFDNDEFKIIAFVTCACIALAMVLTLINICRHACASYTGVRKRAVITLFVILLLVECLMVVSLWMYANSEPILIFVQICLSVVLIFMYLYMKETLMFFVCKFIKQNPHRVLEVFPDQEVYRYMLTYEYPMMEVSC